MGAILRGTWCLGVRILRLRRSREIAIGDRGIQNISAITRLFLMFLRLDLRYIFVLATGHANMTLIVYIGTGGGGSLEA